jgi:hypothetical protein
MLIAQFQGTEIVMVFCESIVHVDAIAARLRPIAMTPSRMTWHITRALIEKSIKRHATA